MSPMSLLCLLFLFLPNAVAFPVETITIHDVYWNSSNPLFETFDHLIDSPGYAELWLKEHDVIKFHCPKKAMKEYSIIYKVSEDDFFHCSLNGDVAKIGTCGPHSHSTFEHSALRSQDDDENTNYYITTSTGTIDGINSRRLGLCLESNMRIAVHLRQHMKPLTEYNLDIQAARMDELYLAEENGALNWKKNVHPVFEAEIEREIQERKLKFDKLKQIDPIPIDDEFVNRIEEMKMMNDQQYLPPDVLVLKNDYEVPSGVPQLIPALAFLSMLVLFL